MGKKLISVSDLSKSEIFEIFELALKKEALFEEYKSFAKGKILTTLFFQPSTRTNLSFKSAILKLGGNYMGFSDIENTRYGSSSNESIEDTLFQINQYSDLIVIRTKDEEILKPLRESYLLPVISAGIGNFEHPTSGMGEALAMMDFLGNLSGLKILIIGKLPKRCIHSFVICLSNWSNIEITIFTPENTCLNEKVIDKSNGIYSINYVKSFDELRELHNLKSFDAIFVDDVDSDHNWKSNSIANNNWNFRLTREIL